MAIASSFRRTLSCGVLVLVACNAQTPEAPTSSTTAAAVTAPCASASTVVAPPPSPASTTVIPTCLRTDDEVAFHTAITTDYVSNAEGKKKRYRERTLRQMVCKRRARTCEGVSVELDLAKGVGLHDAGLMAGARIVADLPNATTIRWGPWRTFTVDHAMGVVTYVESGPTTEGHGEGACKPPSEERPPGVTAL